MSGFFEPRPNQNCFPWGAKDSVWSAPYPFPIEDGASEAVVARLSRLFSDTGVHVCAYSDVQALPIPASPRRPRSVRYLVTAILQARVDPNAGAIQGDETGGGE